MFVCVCVMRHNKMWKRRKNRQQLFSSFSTFYAIEILMPSYSVCSSFPSCIHRSWVHMLFWASPTHSIWNSNSSKSNCNVRAVLCVLCSHRFSVILIRCALLYLLFSIGLFALSPYLFHSLSVHMQLLFVQFENNGHRSPKWFETKLSAKPHISLTFVTEWMHCLH